MLGLLQKIVSIESRIIYQAIVRKYSYFNL